MIKKTLRIALAAMTATALAQPANEEAPKAAEPNEEAAQAADISDAEARRRAERQAAEEFEPSEEISEDLSVPFPVDI